MSFLDTCAVVSGCFFLARDMWRKERTACFIVKKEKKKPFEMGKPAEEEAQY